MIRTKFILLIWLVGYNCYSQPNLILNPSFEDYDSCTSWTGNIGVVTNWGNGNKATPDYYNICNSGSVSIPISQIGYQTAQDSFAFSGIGFVDNSTIREAILGTLNSTLKSGHTYCFGMYINIGNISEYIVDRVGVFFSPDTIISTDFLFNNNSLSPQINIGVSMIKDTVGWTYVSGNFISNGNEKYLLITNFDDNPIWTKINDSINNPDKIASYNFDNISLIDCTPPDIVIPNLLSPNGDGINDKYVILNLPPDSRVSFFNRWGNEIYSTSDYLNEWDGQYMGNLLPTGTYFVVVQFSDGTTKGTFIELMY